MRRDAVAAALPLPRVDPVAGLLWPALVAVAAFASAAPLWSSTLLPYQDAPQHLAAIRVLADYHTPGYGFEKWFTLDLARLQYLGFYLPAAALAKLFGPQAACRLLLSLLALATPAAFWMLLGALGRDRRLAVFAPALFHSAPLYLGFFNFVESIPLALVVVALAERELREPSLRRAAVLAACAGALLWLHPSALAWALGASFILAVTSGQARRRMLRAGAPFVPALVLLGAWAVQALASRDGPGQAAHTGPKWFGPVLQVLELLRYGNVLANHFDELFVLAFGALFAALALQRPRPALDRAWRVPLVAALTFAVYMVSPYDLGFMGYIHLRALPFLFLMLVASPAIAQTRASAWLFGAAAGLMLLYSAELSRTYRAFDAEAQVGAMEQVLRAAEPGRTLTAVIYQQGSHQMQFQSYLHFAAYYEVERGGRARYNFAETPWTPVRFRPETAPPVRERGWELYPERFVPARDATDDYLLVRAPAPDPGPGFSLKAAAGRWALYEAARR